MNMKSFFSMNRNRLTASLVAAGVLAVPMLASNSYIENLMPVSTAQAATDQGQGGQGAGGAMKGHGGAGAHGAAGGNRTTDVNDILRGHGRDALSGSGRPDDKGPPEGEGPSTNMGGGNPNAGDRMGDLYGDLYVVVRDENGEPVLDDLGRVQLLDADGNVIPYVSDNPEDEGFTEVAPENQDLLQEVEFERLNIARAPEAVIDHAYDEAIDKIAMDADGVLEYDEAGRIVVVDADGVEYTIDSPLENLALYMDAMTNPDTVWTVDDAKSFLAGAASKFGNVTVDMVVYLNTILGLNPVIVDEETGDPILDEFGNIQRDYVDLVSYSYDRTDTFTTGVDADGDGVFDPVTVTYLTDPEGDGTYITVTEPLLTAVFGDVDYEGDGADAFAQATDDALQVIEFIHEPIH